MSSTKTVKSATITSTDAQGRGFVSYDTALSQTVSPVQITFAGATLSFATATAFRTFLTEVILPTANFLNSPAGAGGSYAAATPGVAGTDVITA